MPIKNDNKKQVVDLIYIEGPGDIVEAFTQWKNQEDVITETSITFSSQVFDFCKTNQLKSLFISTHAEKKQAAHLDLIARNIPKKIFKGGVGYHVSQLLYGLHILLIALRYRPQHLHVTSGVTYWFMLAPLKLFGIQIFPQFHNTLWPIGFPPIGGFKRFILLLDSWFLSNVASAAFCVSSGVKQQLAEITHNKSCPAYQFTPQFYRGSFMNPPPAQAHNKKPFNIIFAGRIEQNKGVFDILDMAEILSEDNVTFQICGDGSALKMLINQIQQRKLVNRVLIHGMLKRSDLLTIYAQAHVVIIPTRSNFCEGFAMVAAEAILQGRPIITSSIVPALEVLRSAAIEVTPDDPVAYAQAIKKLIDDKALYDSICLACADNREQFLDGSQGLTKALIHSLSA